MSNIELYQGGGAGLGQFQPSVWTKQGRAVARVLGGTELGLARLSGEAQLEQARLDALDAVAGRAMQGVAMVSQLEGQLSSMVPLAASRLQAIGDMHAFTVASEMAAFARRVS